MPPPHPCAWVYLESIWALETLDFDTSGSLSQGPVEFPMSGCKTLLTLLLPLRTMCQNGSESDIFEGGESFTNVGIYYRMSITHIPPEWDAPWGVTPVLTAQNIATHSAWFPSVALRAELKVRADSAPTTSGLHQNQVPQVLGGCVVFSPRYMCLHSPQLR